MTTSLRLTVERLSHDGRGIARHQGKTVFVAGALAGETVDARLQRRHRRYDEARLTQLLVPSPQRVTPPCPHVSACGGCPLQILAADAQLAHKQAVVLDQLRRQGVTPAAVAEPVASAPWGYRRRARLAVTVDRDGARLGYRRPGSRQVTAVSQCPILVPALAELLPALQDWVRAHPQPRALAELALVAADDGVALVWRLQQAPGAPFWQALSALQHSLGVDCWVRERDGLLDYRGEPAAPRLHYRVAGEILAFAPEDFIQGNAAVNEALVARALDWLAPSAEATVADLFCGVGNFSLPLARRAGQVRAYEGSAGSVARAQANAEAAGCYTVQASTLDLAREAPPLAEVDAVLLDPPRAGAAVVAQALAGPAASRVNRVAYVSCDPATLARDCATLVAAGWTAERLAVLDMFPHSAHVESLVLLTRG